MKQIFEYYVPKWDINASKIYMYNIFNNGTVFESTVKLCKKYKRGKVKFVDFVDDLDHIIRWEEWSRCEYETVIGEPFNGDLNTFEKVDCWWYAHPNIEMIARDVIKRWNNYLSGNKDGKSAL